MVYTMSIFFHDIWLPVAHVRALISQHLMCYTKPSLWGFVSCIYPVKLNIFQSMC